MDSAPRGSDVALRRSSDIEAITSRDVSAATIARQGYAHIINPHGVESFESIASSLGSIVMRTDLTITPGRSSIVYKPDAIAFHQDNPAMNVIGWHCVEQDDIDGTARLIDTADVADHFTQEQLKLMAGIDIRCPDPDPSRHNPDNGLVAYFLWPMLTRKPTRCEVYYVPWLMLNSYSADQRRIIAKFDEYLLAQAVIDIRLKQGETLFIDNNRMLHGRGPISAHSKRFLKRVWIKRDA